MTSSRSFMRLVSTVTNDVSMGRSWIVALRMMPVIPMPPAVAQNRSP
jgi:hypothetical protein